MKEQNQRGFRAAFFRANRPGLAGIYNYLVRTRGRGPYSHVELIFSDGVAASSSFSDGGVRFKQIAFEPGKWDVIDLPAEWEGAARAWFVKNEGMPYDTMGNVFLALGFFSESNDKAFCSEAVAAALGIDQAFRLEPNTLFPVLQRMVEVYNAARLTAILECAA